VLFRNDGVSNQGIRVRLRGTESNWSGLGARVTITSGGESWSQTLRSGAGYLSQSELVLTFGLGAAGGEARFDVTWPSGTVDRVEGVDAGATITIEEGTGIVPGP
jgi:hypothetical protein